MPLLAKPRRRQLLFFILLFLLLSLSALATYVNFPLAPNQQETCIFVEPNESFNQFLIHFKQKVPHTLPTLFKIYARLKRMDRALEPGEYCFHARDSLLSVIKIIKEKKRQRHAFVLIAGWTYQELTQHLRQAKALGNKGMLDDNAAIAFALGLKKNRLEGEFYPDTYYYAYPDTPLNLLQQAHRQMQNKILMLYRSGNIAFKNPYALLIAASIIEKESGIPKEQQLVAGVMINRLQRNMKLQMDPTVMYGLGNHRPLTKEDLHEKTPYNTYLYAGLPPTPICMPGETALFAAAFPADTRFLYYVTKNHHHLQFSEKLTEQNAAIKKYRGHQENEE